MNEDRTDEYYKILERLWARVDKSDLYAIKQYNEFKRQLRKDMLGE